MNIELTTEELCEILNALSERPDVDALERKIASAYQQSQTDGRAVQNQRRSPLMNREGWYAESNGYYFYVNDFRLAYITSSLKADGLWGWSTGEKQGTENSFTLACQKAEEAVNERVTR